MGQSSTEPKMRVIDRPSHETVNRGFAIKLAILVAYHYALDRNQQGFEWKMYSFLLVTPFLKLRVYDDFAEWIFSVIQDSIIACFVFLYSCRAKTFIEFMVSFPIQVALCYLFEYLSFQLFAPKDAKYEIKEGVDVRLIPYQMVISLLAWNYADFGDFHHLHSLVAFFFTLIWTDFQFGFTHLLTHKIPSLWKVHRKHHEYSREQLNLWASFYADYVDVLQMMSVLLLPMVCMYILPSQPASYLVYTEWLYQIMFTHSSPLCPRAFSLMIFWEWEALYTLEGRSFSNYHPAHHAYTCEYFSIWGIVPDWLLEKWSRPIVEAYKGANIKTM